MLNLNQIHCLTKRLDETKYVKKIKAQRPRGVSNPQPCGGLGR